MLRPDSPRVASARGFTVIELLIVMAIIVVLAGLVLGTYGYVQRKGSTSRAEAEIKAIEAACESYKADHGVYPQDSATDTLDARTQLDPTAYSTASLVLYSALSGDSNADRAVDSGKQSYMIFKPQMLSPSDAADPVTHIRDPFGNSYGYSTANQADPTKGYNPTFDLWSTANADVPPSDPTAVAAAQAKWIKNW